MRPLSLVEALGYLAIGVAGWIAQLAEARAVEKPTDTKSRSFVELILPRGNAASFASLFRLALCATVCSVCAFSIGITFYDLVHGNRGSAVAGNLLLLGGGIATLTVLIIGPHRVAPFRGLRRDKPVSWMAVAGTFFAIAWTLSPGVNLNLTSSMLAHPPSAWDFSLTYLVMAAVAILGVGIGVRRNPREVIARLGLQRVSWKAIAAGALLGMVTFVVGIWVQSFVTSGPSPCSGQMAQLAHLGDLAAQGVLPRLLLVVVVSLGEDILCRGAIQPREGIVVGAVIATLLTVYSCSGWPTTGKLYIFGLSLVFGLVRKYFGLTASIFSHSAYNLGIMILVQP